MLTTKRNYKKKYVIGAPGNFDSIGRMSSINAAKQLASAGLQAGKTEAKRCRNESY